MTQADYEQTRKKKFPWGWTIGGLAAFGLLGMCSLAFVGMFKNIGVVTPINSDFIEIVLSDQLPSVSEGIYSEKSGVTDKCLEPVNLMIATLGPPESIATPACTANSNASTSDLSGEFVNCNGVVEYAISNATVTTRWRKEGEDWKLLHFNLNVADIDAYTDLVVQKKLEAREETPAQEESEAP